MVNGPFGMNTGNVNGRSIGKMAKTMGVLGPGATVLDTYLNMKAGDDFGTAAFKAAATGMLWATAPGVMGAHMAGSLITEGVIGANQWHRQAKEKYAKNMYMGTVGGGYVDNNRALTMRQAAVSAIQGSKLNARSALGGEAKILNQNMHRSF